MFGREDGSHCSLERDREAGGTPRTLRKGLQRCEAKGGQSTESAPEGRSPTHNDDYDTRLCLRTARGRHLFLVRSREPIPPCSVCGGALQGDKTVTRQRWRPSGEIHQLILRQFRCDRCRRYHRELPDLLVPYKRYDAESIEAGLLHDPDISVAADDSTLARWRQWFGEWSPVAAQGLRALAQRSGARGADPIPSRPLPPLLRRLGPWVGDAPGWLARAVRPLVNARLYAFTGGSPGGDGPDRSAWPSGP